MNGTRVRLSGEELHEVQLALLAQVCLKQPDGRSIFGSGHHHSVAYSEEAAGDSERRRPLIPIEAGRDCDVAPYSRVGVLVSTFDRLGAKFLALGGRLAQAGACGTLNRIGIDLDAPVAENEIFA